jgi:putative intracellular protease/amidase
MVQQLANKALLEWLRQRPAKAETVMSVCTCSALLAKARPLDRRRATSNKQFFQLVVAQGPKVRWRRRASG